MKVMIDGRPLLRPWMGGVPRLASGLVPALVKALEPDTAVIKTSGLKNGLPNKLVAALTFLGIISYDQFFAKEHADLLFLPNLEFVGQPKIPYALLVHDMSFLIEPKWFGWKSRLWHILVKPQTLIKNATHHFAVSETTKRDLIHILGINQDKITVIPIGIEMEPPIVGARLIAPLQQNNRFILSLGGTRKNVECIKTAHAELIKNPKYSDVKLKITGTPELPRPTYPELFALMRDAAIFCYPSWYEGFGLPLHEAAHFGTPCIASTSGSLPEIAPSGTRFAPPAKPHYWIEAICQALDKPEDHKTTTTIGNWDEASLLIAKKLRTLAK
ncbi:MAG: glycosyltransferase family 1 protein [Candidatus Uhrbacteria bacterium]